MRALKITIILLSLLPGLFVTAQSEVEKTDNKATVYIVRTKSMGSAINFKYFIDDQYIGKWKYGKYMKLELEAGDYLIWAKSENKSFLEAHLDGGKTYVINALPKMGGFKAAVELKAVNNQDEKEMAKVKKYLTTKKLVGFDCDEIKAGQAELSDFIAKSLLDYKENWMGKKEISILYEPTDLEDVKILSN